MDLRGNVGVAGVAGVTDVWLVLLHCHSLFLSLSLSLSLFSTPENANKIIAVIVRRSDIFKHVRSGPKRMQQSCIRLIKLPAAPATYLSTPFFGINGIFIGLVSMAARGHCPRLHCSPLNIPLVY